MSPDFAAAIAIVLANRLFARRLVTFRPGFWGLQGVNAVGAGWFAIRGFEGLERYPVAGWAVALLLVFHIGKNVALMRESAPRP